MKNSNNIIGNRTSDLPVCSTRPQPRVPPFVTASFTTIPNHVFNSAVNDSKRDSKNKDKRYCGHCIIMVQTTVCCQTTLRIHPVD